MYLRTNDGIINFDNIDRIFVSNGIHSGKPCIVIGFSNRYIECEMFDKATAERKLDEIEHALRDGAVFFDMR